MNQNGKTNIMVAAIESMIVEEMIKKMKKKKNQYYSHQSLDILGFFYAFG